MRFMASDAVVVLAYNILDDFFYECGLDSYTAGFFAPGFIEQYGMNVIVIDSFDWANRVGEPTFLYEGVIAHELEHLLMNYSDPGELSWVDEGLAEGCDLALRVDPLSVEAPVDQALHPRQQRTHERGRRERVGHVHPRPPVAVNVAFHAARSGIAGALAPS